MSETRETLRPFSGLVRALDDNLRGATAKYDAGEIRRTTRDEWCHASYAAFGKDVRDLIARLESAAVQPEAAEREDTARCVMVPVETARLLDRVYLPAAPNRMRSAHPDVVAAVCEFKRLVFDAARATQPDAGAAEATEEA